MEKQKAATVANWLSGAILAAWVALASAFASTAPAGVPTFMAFICGLLVVVCAAAILAAVVIGVVFAHRELRDHLERHL